MAGLGAFLTGTGQVLRGINQGNDEADQRAYLSRVRESGVRKLDAEDSVLPAETAAKAASAALATERDSAARDLVKPKAKLEATTTDTAQKRADWELGHLPSLFEIADQGMKTRILQSKADAKRAEFDLEQLPGTIAKARSAGALDDVKTADALMGGLGHALVMGDRALVTKYVQGVANSGVYPQLAGRTIGEVGTATEEDGSKTFVVRDGEGHPLMAIPGKKVQESYLRMNPGEWKTVPADGSLVKIQNGQVVDAAHAPKTIKPADRANLTRSGVNDAVKALDAAYGIKRDPISNMIDASTIKDKTQYYKDIAEAERRIKGGEEPMAVASDLAGRAQRKQEIDSATGAGGGKGAAAGEDFSNLWKGGK